MRQEKTLQGVSDFVFANFYSEKTSLVYTCPPSQVQKADFFADVGLRQGDVVRRVNSLHMTSQKRAEYFIGEFVKGELGAVVLDIDREGRPEKLVYLIK